MEKIVLGATKKHLKNKAVTGCSQLWAREGKAFSNLISFCTKVIHLVDEGKALNFIFLDFS